MDGNTLARTSKSQLSLGLNYRHVFSGGWVVHARFDTNYQSKQYATAINQGYVPDRNISNVSAGLRGPEHWKFSLWAKNVFDEDYVSSSFHLDILRGPTLFI